MREARTDLGRTSKLIVLLEAALAEADRCGSVPAAAHIAQAIDLVDREDEDRHGKR